MCCILYCLTHPEFGLNRDEFLKRPAAPSQWHRFPLPNSYSIEGSPSVSIALPKKEGQFTPNGSSSENSVLSGVDAHPSGGGTWLGITRSGRIAAITNFTEAAPPPLPQGRGIDVYRSRGSLVKDWLKREGKAECDEIEDFLTGVANHMDEWPGFNLLVGQISSHTNIGYLSNRSGSEQTVYLEKSETFGSGGLSNSCLGNPWDKVNKGKSFLDAALAHYDQERRDGRLKEQAEKHLTQALFEILESRTEIQQRSDFMNSIQIPPVQLINDAWYATRTATVILARRNGHIQWWEKDVWVLSEQGEPIRADKLSLPSRYFEWQL